MSRNMFGKYIGDDVSSSDTTSDTVALLTTALKGGKDIYDKDKKQKDAAADAKKKLDAAIAADRVKAVADAVAATSLALSVLKPTDSGLKDKADADKIAANAADAAQIKAMADLPADQMGKRTQAAQDALKDPCRLCRRIRRTSTTRRSWPRGKALCRGLRLCR